MDTITILWILFAGLSGLTALYYLFNSIYVLLIKTETETERNNENYSHWAPTENV